MGLGPAGRGKKRDMGEELMPPSPGSFVGLPYQHIKWGKNMLSVRWDLGKKLGYPLRRRAAYVLGYGSTAIIKYIYCTYPFLNMFNYFVQSVSPGCHKGAPYSTTGRT